jgi:hypothetical protein
VGAAREAAIPEGEPPKNSRGEGRIDAVLPSLTISVPETEIFCPPSRAGGEAPRLPVAESPKLLVTNLALV